MKAIRILSSIILFAYSFINVSADNIRFRNLDIENGLSNPTVECFYQDYLGFMWIGTSNGLNKYDGYSIVKYFHTKNDSTSLSNNDIRCIYEDKFHNLWIGTFNSIDIYNRAQNNFIHKRLPDGVFTARTFFQDSNGNLWLGTYGNGLYKFNYNTFEFEHVDFKELDNSSISVIYEDKKGNIWIGTELNGILVLDRSKQKVFNFKNFIPGIGIGKDFSNYRVRAFVEDNLGNIWIGTYGQGLFGYNAHEGKFLNDIHINKLPDLISGISVDLNGILWIATDGNGIYSYNSQEGELVHYEHNKAELFSLCSNAIRTIYYSQNILWIGSFSGGLSYVPATPQTGIPIARQSTTQSNGSNNITGISGDSNNRLWLTTDGGGIFTFDRSKKLFSTVTIPKFENLNRSAALAIFKDKDQNFWISYYLSGFIKIEQGNYKVQNFYPVLPSIGGNDIRAIAQDNNTGTLWMGTDGDGIFSFQEGKGIQQHFINKYDHDSNAIVYNFIRTILIDSKGNIWIGTSSGLSRYNAKENRFINFAADKNDNTLASNSINCIMESSEGYLYFGTENGLSVSNYPVWSEKFDAPNLASKSECFSFTSYDLSSGLPDNIVNSLVEDNNANIWIGTSGGLSQFNPKLRRFKEIPIEDHSKLVFNRNSAYKASDGTLYFGTTNGLVYFDPNAIKEAPNDARVLFTDIKINFESIANSKNSDTSSVNTLQRIELSTSQKAITIEFSSMKMIMPEKIRYSYQLQGFDENWITIDANHRFATYTNLSPGTYYFKIKATNYEGVWSDNVTQMMIVVKPPFYKTWWFKGLILFFSITLLYLFYSIRVRSVTKRNEKLEQLVRERSEEIRKKQEEIRLQEIDRQELLIKQKELEASRLTAEKELITLRNQKLESELEDQRSEISKRNSELAITSFQINQKIEFLSHLKSYLKDLLEKSPLEDKKTISNLIQQIEKDNSLKKEWEQFEFHFDQANNNYFQKLKSLYPDLTIKDLQMCAYLRLSLSNKEISSMLNISIRGVEKSRSRLRKKMNLDKDSNLSEFLIQL